MSNIKPTLEQQKIINSTARHVLTEAGPGVGKTTVLWQTAVQRLRRRKGFGKILLLVFSRQKAQDLRQLFSDHPSVEVRTFHSFCYRLVLRHHAHLGFSTKPVLQQSSNVKKTVRDYVKNALKRLNIDPKDPKQRTFRLRLQRYVLDQLSREELQDEFSTNYPEATLTELLKIKDIYDADQTQKCHITYKKQITLALQLLENHPDLIPEYDLIIVDEAQDIDESQYRMLLYLDQRAKQLMLFGDATQSIFQFRGAINAFQRLKADFPRTKRFHLTQSFRQTRQILKTTNAVHQESAQAPQPRLHSDRTGPKPIYIRFANVKHHDARFILNYQFLVQIKHVKPNTIAVLARMKVSLNEIHRLLSTRGFPALLGEPSLLERLVAVYSLLLWFWLTPAVLTLSHATALLKHLKLDTTHSQILYRFLQGKKTMKASRAQLPKDFHYLLQAFSDGRTLKPRAQILQAARIFKYYIAKDPIFIDRYTADLRLKLGEQSDPIIIDDLLEAYYQDCLNGPRLMTIHASKGQEFEAVLVVDVEDGKFPYEKAIKDGTLEHERNMLYVAITRPRKHLYLFSTSHTRYEKGSVAEKTCQSRLLSPAVQKTLKPQRHRPKWATRL